VLTRLFAHLITLSQGIVELMKCRLTLKNFAWNQHWLMFVPYGLLKEVRGMSGLGFSRGTLYYVYC